MRIRAYAILNVFTLVVLVVGVHYHAAAQPPARFDFPMEGIRLLHPCTGQDLVLRGSLSVTVSSMMNSGGDVIANLEADPSGVLAVTADDRSRFASNDVDERTVRIGRPPASIVTPVRFIFFGPSGTDRFEMEILLRVTALPEGGVLVAPGPIYLNCDRPGS